MYLNRMDFLKVSSASLGPQNSFQNGIMSWSGWESEISSGCEKYYRGPDVNLKYHAVVRMFQISFGELDWNDPSGSY